MFAYGKLISLHFHNVIHGAVQLLHAVLPKYLVIIQGFFFEIFNSIPNYPIQIQMSLILNYRK